jgi:HEAT repeat protein
MNFATSGFSVLITVMVILGALQVAYFVVSGGLKGTRYYFQARIHDPNPAVRAGVIRALAARGDATALEFLLQAVGDSEPNNRLAAIDGMRRFSDPAVQEALIKLAGDPQAIVRRAAVSALSRYPTPMAIETLVKRLTDAVPAVQIAAIQGLKVAQDPATIEAIAHALASQDKDVVRQAQEALLPFGIPVIERLGAMLPEVGAAAPALIRVMTHLDRELASRAIARVLPDMRHSVASAEALQILVRSQHPGLVSLLAQLLDVPDYPSHDLVLQSFVKLHHPDSIVPLCRHLGTTRFRSGVVAALEALAPVYGREMIPPLAEAMRHPERTVRKAASHLLGRVGGTLMIDAGLVMLWGEDAAGHRAFLERHLGYSLHRLATYHEAALSLDRLMTGTMGEEGQRAIDELESLMILLFGDSMRGVVVNDHTQLILKDRRTLYAVRVEHLNPLAAELLEFAANQAEGDRFRLTPS